MRQSLGGALACAPPWVVITSRSRRNCSSVIDLMRCVAAADADHGRLACQALRSRMRRPRGWRPPRHGGAPAMMAPTRSRARRARHEGFVSLEPRARRRRRLDDLLRDTCSRHRFAAAAALLPLTRSLLLACLLHAARLDARTGPLALQTRVFIAQVRGQALLFSSSLSSA
jgi:hypothetical protein